MTIPYAKDHKTKSELNVLKQRIRKAILEADEKGDTNCSLNVDKMLPQEIEDELKEKGYKTATHGVTNFFTVYIYW